MSAQNPAPEAFVLQVYDAIDRYRGWVSMRDLYNSLGAPKEKVRKAVRSLEKERQLETKTEGGEKAVRVANPTVIGVDGKMRSFKDPRKKRKNNPTSVELVRRLKF